MHSEFIFMFARDEIFKMNVFQTFLKINFEIPLQPLKILLKPPEKAYPLQARPHRIPVSP